MHRMMKGAFVGSLDLGIILAAKIFNGAAGYSKLDKNCTAVHSGWDSDKAASAQPKRLL